MKNLLFAFVLLAGLSVMTAHASHSGSSYYGNYYHSSVQDRYDQLPHQHYRDTGGYPFYSYGTSHGHKHHVTADHSNYKPWYHTHDGSHHFHNISYGHTSHTKPYSRYYSSAYRRYDYDHDKDCDYKRVYGQKYPGRPNMSYQWKSSSSCGCSSTKRYYR